MGAGLDVLGSCDGTDRPDERRNEETVSHRGSRSGSEMRHSDPRVRDAGPSNLGHEFQQHADREMMKEKAREWQRQIRSETRRIDRDIQKVRQEENRLKREITAMAKRGQEEGVKTLAKQVVRSRKSVAMLERTKCSMTAMNLQLTTAIASFSTASSLKMSTSMMQAMNQLTNVPELQRTMEEMRTELARAEVAEEIMQEGLEMSDDEEEADSEVEKVYEELALDTSQLLASGSAPTRIPAGPPAMPAPIRQVPSGDPLAQRLQALHQS